MGKKTYKIYRYWVETGGQEWNYVGQTVKSRGSRGGSWKTLSGYKDQPKFYSAIQKYGPESFQYEVIWETSDKQEAFDLEKMTIEILDSIEHGFNSSIGGYGNTGCHNQLGKKRKVKTPEHKFETAVNIARGKGRSGVVQYDLDGNYIAEYPLIKHAAEKIGISHTSIIFACQGKRKTAGGFIWRYKGTN